MNAKLQEIIFDHGIEGYGLYWYCLELVAQSVSSDNLTFELKHDARIIGRNIGMPANRVEEIMKAFIANDLFSASEGRIQCLKLAQRCDDFTAKAVRRKGVKTITNQQVGVRPSESEKVPPEEEVRRKKKEEEKNTYSDQIEEAFAVFYSAGMRKLNPKGALKSFTALCKKSKKEFTPIEIANHLANDVKIRLANNQMGFDKMHPTTYLNNERWNDERVQESNEAGNQESANERSARKLAEWSAQRNGNYQGDEQAGMALEYGQGAIPHKMD